LAVKPALPALPVHPVLFVRKIKKNFIEFFILDNKNI
jgi:hypothetical protein